MDLRNPYVILGLPFGASRERASIAFARKARGLRRKGDAGKDELTDLTWALNQLDEVIADPDKALDVYRIPADPNAFEASGVGVFNPPPERLARRTPSSADDARQMFDRSLAEVLRWTALHLAAATPLPSP